MTTESWCHKRGADPLQATSVLVCDFLLYLFKERQISTIIDKVLQKVLKERPQQLLLIAPELKEAPWFPLLQQLLLVKSLPLPVQVGDLRQPHWHHLHQQPALFNLHLWCVSFPP